MVEVVSGWFVSIGVPPLLGGALISLVFLVLFKWLLPSRSDGKVDYGLSTQIGRSASKSVTRAQPVELPADVRAAALELARAGNKIAAIKLVREATGLGLKAAKDLVDAMR